MMKQFYFKQLHLAYHLFALIDRALLSVKIPVQSGPGSDGNV